MVKKFEEWLDSGISDDPIMLHGTSADAILKLIKNGKLYPGNVGDMKDRIFFTPVFKWGDLSEFDKWGNLPEFDLAPKLNDALRHASDYARFATIRHCIMNQFGVSRRLYENKPNNTEHALIDLNDAKVLSDTELKEFCKNYGIKKPLLEVKRILDKYLKRKGVIVEPKMEILQLPYEFEDCDSLSVYCPNGLDSKYIKGISPLSDIDRRTLVKSAKTIYT
jgi:hypothetical protein